MTEIERQGRMRRLVIIYHGTDANNSKKILQSGFKKGTYFAVHLEDALGYGGKYIFELCYPAKDIPKSSWQFISDLVIPPEFIVRLTKYNPSKVKYDNMVLRHMICRSNSTSVQIRCTTDDMRTRPSAYTGKELIAYGMRREEDGK